MDDINKAINDKRIYSNLKNIIYNIILNLNYAIEYLEMPMDNFINCYRINEIGADNKEIYKVREKLIKRRDSLKNVVLVEIDRLIGQSDQVINSQESEE